LIFFHLQGYYRVTYDDTLWDKISTVLDSKNFNDIDEISRSQIVDDLLNLARAGTKTYTNVLNTLKFLKRDDSYYTWYAAFNGFSYLLKRTSDETLTKLLTVGCSSID
jgi:aminopeptidase N